MNRHADTAPDLTKNQSLVMNALSEASGPMSAYSILDQLRDHGFRAPPQVYRALDKLVEFGMVHRLESLNAFVACQLHSCDGDSDETVMFTICEDCGNVSELAGEELLDAVQNLARKSEFTLKKSVIELRGICSDCN
ncbi:MAG: transcriptional repressor [Rhizobiaceae bacterium]